MITFTKHLDPDNSYDTTKITFETNSVILEDLLDDFKRFLLSAGFIVDGVLTVTEQEKEYTRRITDLDIGAAHETVTKHYFENDADPRTFHALMAAVLNGEIL